MAGPERGNPGQFWTTLPGILTAVAALVTAAGTLVGTLFAVGVLGTPKPTATPFTTPAVTPTSPVATVGDAESTAPSEDASVGPLLSFSLDVGGINDETGDPPVCCYPVLVFHVQNRGDASGHIEGIEFQTTHITASYHCGCVTVYGDPDIELPRHLSPTGDTDADTDVEPPTFSQQQVSVDIAPVMDTPLEWSVGLPDEIYAKDVTYTVLVRLRYTDITGGPAKYTEWSAPVWLQFAWRDL